MVQLGCQSHLLWYETWCLLLNKEPLFHAMCSIAANCLLHAFRVSGFWACGYKLRNTEYLVLSFSEKRCPTLAMPANGGFKCVDGAYFNSRCEYYCSPGYTLKGERTVTCMDNKAWSGRPASCVGKNMPQASGAPSWERSSRSLLV